MQAVCMLWMEDGRTMSYVIHNFTRKENSDILFLYVCSLVRGQICASCVQFVCMLLKVDGGTLSCVIHNAQCLLGKRTDIYKLCVCYGWWMAGHCLVSSIMSQDVRSLAFYSYMYVPL